MTLRDRKGPQGGPYRGIIYMEDHKRNLTRDHSGAFISFNMVDNMGTNTLDKIGHYTGVHTGDHTEDNTKD